MRNKHQKYMESAIKLALKAKGFTSPNPLVGALLVKNNKIISTGFHQKAGTAHAEVVAIGKAKEKARGATLYVTLEPCSSYGKTPPCTDKIIQSGIKKVVIGMVDPNPIYSGKGIKCLAKQGIEVKVGFLEDRLKKMNDFFLKYITKRLPFVTVKVAQSLDGKIATHRSDSQWITEERSRSYSHRMRRYYDAIMVGVNTVLRDNPKLNAADRRKKIIKIIVDSQLSTPCDANIFKGDSPVIIATIATQEGQETENRNILSQKAKILDIREKDGQVNIRDLLKKLAALGIANILVEGGGNLIGSLFDECLVDKVLFFSAPKIIGGKEAISSVMGKGVSRVERAIKLKNFKLKRIGDDFLVEGYIRYPCSRG